MEEVERPLDAPEDGEATEDNVAWKLLCCAPPEELVSVLQALSLDIDSFGSRCTLLNTALSELRLCGSSLLMLFMLQPSWRRVARELRWNGEPVPPSVLQCPSQPVPFLPSAEAPASIVAAARQRPQVNPSTNSSKRLRELAAKRVKAARAAVPAPPGVARQVPMARLLEGVELPVQVCDWDPAVWSAEQQQQLQALHQQYPTHQQALLEEAFTLARDRTKLAGDALALTNPTARRIAVPVCSRCSSVGYHKDAMCPLYPHGPPQPQVPTVLLLRRDAPPRPSKTPRVDVVVKSEPVE